MVDFLIQKLHDIRFMTMLLAAKPLADRSDAADAPAFEDPLSVWRKR